MIDLALHRMRTAIPASDERGRRDTGAHLLEGLRALARRVEALLPDLASLSRISAPPRAETLYVGWRIEAGEAASVPRFVIALTPTALEARWGYGRAGEGGALRRRHIAEGLRRRRALGDALHDHLATLRGAGASLHLRGGDPVPVSEEEWARAASGAVAFTWSLAGLDAGEVLARRVAEALGRLAAFARLLGAFPDPAPDAVVRGPNDLLDGVRALRWEERAQGVAAPPAGIVPYGRSFTYDPVSGWFAPSRFAARQPPSLARQRLEPVGSTDALAAYSTVAAVERGLHARLGRWLASRGVRDGAVAQGAEVRVPGTRVPATDECPALESIVARVIGDPSGDIAVAVAALMECAPWSGIDPTDPVTVAARLPVRLAPAVARGVARLVEHGVLRREDDATSRCLGDDAMRPVLALAIERALGGLDVFPQGSAVLRARPSARAWELSGIARAATLEVVARRFAAYALAQGVALPLDLVRSMLIGLRAKPFALLAGVSGTGKTRAAQLLARFLTEGAGAGGPRVAVVPVRPDWLDSRGFLGWLNALQGAWEDTAALRVLLHALEEPSEPHFILLDEMNLARVEHYLAEVLSALESGAPIPLHGRAAPVPTTDGARLVPPELTLAPNVFLIGTVNVDETTHALSPKVLDRAWTWEFAPMPPSALARAWLGERRVAAPASADERAAVLDAARVDDPVRAMVLAMGRDGVGARVDALYEAMARHGRPFGFRVATELLRFVQLCEREAVDTPPAWWLDHAVLGKVLPAVQGARREVEPLLRALLPILEGAEGAVARDRVVAESPRARPTDPLPASAAKAREMLERATRTGFVTFAR